MKTLLKWLFGLAVVGSLGAAGYVPLHQYLKTRKHPGFRHLAVTHGEITWVVNSTGTIQPVLSVQIGSFVSGPITKINVDFNSRVHEKDLLALVDPKIYKANVARDKATVAHSKADVERVKALLQQATNDEKRSQLLRKTKSDFISDAEMDQFKFARLSLQAQLELAEATVEQSEANLVLSEANLKYTEITSPVDGVVIDRKIDPGQTIAASFQTPVLFVVAPDLEKKIYVLASVDEADLGWIRDAKRREQPVLFTVDAYPDDLFTGSISQVRLNPTTTQNVVTYTVVVEAPNTELKLLPGMTANLSFQIDRQADVLKIPNAALRFYPKPEQVRPEDQKLLEGAADPELSAEEQPDTSESRRSATERAESARDRNRRHVWVEDGDLLRAIEVKVGLSDNSFTELVSGPLKQGQELVTGLRPPGYKGP